MSETNYRLFISLALLSVFDTILILYVLSLTLTESTGGFHHTPFITPSDGALALFAVGMALVLSGVALLLFHKVRLGRKFFKRGLAAFWLIALGAFDVSVSALLNSYNASHVYFSEVAMHAFNSSSIWFLSFILALAALGVVLWWVLHLISKSSRTEH